MHERVHNTYLVSSIFMNSGFAFHAWPCIACILHYEPFVISGQREMLQKEQSVYKCIGAITMLMLKV